VFLKNLIFSEVELSHPWLESYEQDPDQDHLSAKRWTKLGTSVMIVNLIFYSYVLMVISALSNETF
jgi:hypothetical protein